MMNPQQIIDRNLTIFLVKGKEYHSPLPEELLQWYCYTSDGGHSILVVLNQNFNSTIEVADYMGSAPVKTVLRGYTLKTRPGDNLRYVVVDIPYTPELGLLASDEDTEF